MKANRESTPTCLLPPPTTTTSLTTTTSATKRRNRVDRRQRASKDAGRRAMTSSRSWTRRSQFEEDAFLRPFFPSIQSNVAKSHRLGSIHSTISHTLGGIRSTLCHTLGGIQHRDSTPRPLSCLWVFCLYAQSQEPILWRYSKIIILYAFWLVGLFWRANQNAPN